MASTKETPDTVGILFWAATCIFCLAGVSNSYFANELDLKGAGDPLTGFQPTALWMGETITSAIMLLCGGTRFHREHFDLSFKYWYILVFDVVGNILYWTGLGFVGSGLTTVLYSSIVVWTGVFSRFMFGKSLSCVRWVTIFCIWASIALSAVGQVKSFSGDGQVIGIFLVLVSSAFFGLNFVLLENLVVTKVSPLECAFFFWPNMVLGLMWISTFDAVFWRRYVTDPVKENNPDYSAYAIAVLLALFLTSNAIHQISFFFQVNGGKVPAVTSAVNKSLQSVLVFILSDLCYCPTHSWNKHIKGDTQLDQCITTWKLIGFIGTVLGVLVYSFDGLLWGKERDVDLRAQQYDELSCGGDELSACSLVSSVNVSFPS